MRFESRRPRNDEERVLPLINVVFLLLIFFMLAGRLASSEPFQVNPPQSESQGPLESRDMVLLLGAEGEIALDGELMSELALAQAVAQRLSANPEARLRLKADGGVQSTTVVALLETLRDAGLTDLKLLTVPAQR